MFIFLAIGGLIVVAGLGVVTAALIGARTQHLLGSAGLGAAGFIGGAAVMLMGRAIPRLAPYVCPNCRKPAGFPSDSPQAIEWLDKHFPR